MFTVVHAVIDETNLVGYINSFFQSISYSIVYRILMLVYKPELDSLYDNVLLFGKKGLYLWMWKNT